MRFAWNGAGYALPKPTVSFALLPNDSARRRLASTVLVPLNARLDALNSVLEETGDKDLALALEETEEDTL